MMAYHSCTCESSLERQFKELGAAKLPGRTHGPREFGWLVGRSV